MSEKNKKSYYVSDENIATLNKVASEQKRSVSSMVDIILTDTFDGSMINKHSVKDFADANPRATIKQLMTYFNIG